MEEGICNWGAGRFGAGEPVADKPVGTILFGRGLSRRAGMSRNSSERRTVRLDDVAEVVGAFDGAFEGMREGCRLRIGMMGTGGVGSNLDDRRRAAISSSSKTVASVRVLIGLKWSSVTFCLGWSDFFGGAGQPSSSALIARPICDIGTEAALTEVPTPGRTTVRPDPDARVETPSVLNGDGVTRRGNRGAGPSREAAGGGAIGSRVEDTGVSSIGT